MALSAHLQLANAFAQSWLAYSFKGKPRPFSASFVVSNQCNIHCKYCNFPSMTTNQLSIDQINVLFDKLRNLGVKRLGLLGGEPLYRGDIIEIIGLAKQKGFFVSLNSNLLMYRKFRNQLNDVDYFFTSLDGRPERHVSNRGPQNFDKIIDAIRDIRSLGKRLTAICVVTEPDRSDVDYLLDLAQAEGFNVHFQPECYDTEIVQGSAPSFIPDAEIRQFWDYIILKKKQGKPISSSLAYLSYIRDWHDFSLSSLYDANDRCAAGRGYIFVDAEGIAYPCAYTKGKTKGVNLLEQDWRECFTETPCTRCIVGPMLEFNLLFSKPVSTGINSAKHLL